MDQNVILFLQIKKFWFLYWKQNYLSFAYCSVVVFSLHSSEGEGQIEYSNDERS